ncbi:MAG: hypothetical protein SGCHY_001091 [Lobulomycetales sp.]
MLFASVIPAIVSILFATQIVDASPFPWPIHGPCIKPHIVRPGDSFFSIGSDLGIPITYLKLINADVAPNPELIMAGQTVCLCRGPAPIIAPPPPLLPAYAPMPPVLLDMNGYPLPMPGCVKTYPVCVGDTLSCIATKFGLSTPGIIALNPQIPNPDLIFPGQTVCIAAAPAGLY